MKAQRTRNETRTSRGLYLPFLAEIRMTSLMKQEDIARAIGVEKRTVQGWEGQEWGCPLHKVRPLAKFLGCAVDALTGEGRGVWRVAGEWTLSRPGEWARSGNGLQWRVFDALALRIALA